jgi:hypothetical protein
VDPNIHHQFPRPGIRYFSFQWVEDGVVPAQYTHNQLHRERHALKLEDSK